MHERLRSAAQRAPARGVDARGSAREQNNKASHAVVIGCGIAGMCAARVLSEHYELVTIIERDRLPGAPDHRPGVPQSHHGHGLLLRGLNELDDLFPGFAERLLASGAERVDLGAEFAHLTEWGWSPRVRTGVSPISSNRLTIEHTLRELMRAQVPNLNVREQTRAQNLVVEREPRLRVTGIEVNGPLGREVLEADLVVETSGKNGMLVQRLEALGLSEPPTEVVDPDSAYGSRFYRLPTPAPKEWWWKGMLIDAKVPDQPRCAMLLPCGDNRLVLMLIGMNGDYPPGDEAGYMEYIRSLPTPYLAHVISQCEPLSPIHRSKRLANRWRHFERWSSELPGFLCLGDALATFTPFHGQGMTVAAAAAQTLGQKLRELGPDPVRLPPAFYRANAKFVGEVWGMATTMDLGWPRTEGKRTLMWYLMTVILPVLCRSVHDDNLLKVYLGNVFHLTEHWSVALKPRILAQIIYSIVRRALFGPAVPRDYDPGLGLAAGFKENADQTLEPQAAE
jgi:2-polyprenyl-6-methoxyphenol hydroxylase-like FAD-dependent oxidoreductase